MATRRFLLLGAGDLAREVAKFLLQTAEVSKTTCEIATFCRALEEKAPEFQRFCFSVDEALKLFPPAEWRAVGCVGNPKVRAVMYRQFLDQGYTFATVCAQDTTMFAEQIGAGCIVFPGARLGIGCRLAEDVVVNYNATIGHDAVIGAHSVISPGVQLGGRISCGQRVLFGIGSCVLPRKTIGDGAVLSAGSAIWTDVPEGSTMVGVPATVRKMPGRSPIQSEAISTELIPKDS